MVLPKILLTTEKLTATQELAQQLCDPVYNSNASLSSSVSAAIASATAAAVSALAGKSLQDTSTYPLYSVSAALSLPLTALKILTHLLLSHKSNLTLQQECTALALPQSPCTNATNATCVCKDTALLNAIEPCQQVRCSDADLISM